MDQPEFNREVLAKNILSQKWQNALTQIYYVLVHKESESGLLYNERMLVLEQHTFTLFYSKLTRPLPQLLEIHQKGLSAFKERIPVLSAVVKRSQNIINLHFRTNNIKRIWTFKFTSNSLAEKWAFLFAEVQEKCITRSLKSKETGSSSHLSESAENYASILSNKPTQEKPPPSHEEQYDSRRKKLAIQKLQ